MTKEYSHRAEEDVVLHNLEILKRDAEALQEETALVLKDCFLQLVPEGLPFEKASRILLDFCKKNQQRLPEKELTDLLLCQFLAERFPTVAERQKDFPFSVDPHAPNHAVTLLYWASNRLSSQAADRFSSLFSSAATLPAESFSEVCERVAGGECDFGIIPIENTTDGRISAFYKMLDRHELRICAVCDIEDVESDTQTRLALVGLRAIPPRLEFPLFVEFSFVSEKDERRHQLFSTANRLHIALTRHSSAPLSYRTGVEIDTVTYELTQGLSLPFLIYLHLFFSDATIIGFFVQI